MLASRTIKVQRINEEVKKNELMECKNAHFSSSLRLGHVFLYKARLNARMFSLGYFTSALSPARGRCIEKGGRGKPTHLIIRYCNEEQKTINLT